MKQILMGVSLAVAMMVLPRTLIAGGPAPVDLGSAANFTILAATAISSTDGGSINWDVGLSPALGSSITGLTTNQVAGTIYTVDDSGPSGSVANPGLLTTATNDLATAYTNAAGRSATTSYGPIYDLGGQTLTAGVYNGSSSFAITGILTLDGAGDPSSVWIFQVGSTLITAAGAVGSPASEVVLTNGARASNVFWQVGTSVTLGTYSIFKGNIMAHDSVTMNTGSIMDGRALAQNGAVTFNSLSGGLPILSISVSPSTWAAGTMAAGANQMSSAGNKITVTNDGTVAETFTLQISNQDDKGEWTHSPSKSGAANNVYVLSGIFCAGTDSPAAGSFNQAASEDVLTTTEQNATVTQFTYAEGSATGVAVPVDEGRSLWLRLDTPTAGTGGIEHTITIRVGCFQP